MKVNFRYQQHYTRIFHECEFDYDNPDWIDITTYETGVPGASKWFHKIRKGEIVWRQDDLMKLSVGAKDYFQQEVSKIFHRWKAFL